MEPLKFMSSRMSHYTMFIMQVLASQLHFLANTNAGLAILPLLWPVNCIKMGEHVALLSGPTVHSLYCGQANIKNEFYKIYSVLRTTLLQDLLFSIQQVLNFILHLVLIIVVFVLCSSI